MTTETKNDVLERVIEQKKPLCPHCNLEMSIWEVPPMSFSDGLGWGAPYLFVCFNDECPPFKAGWDHIYENYAYRASYRCMCEPASPDKFDFLPVFSAEGGSNQIVDENGVNSQKAIEESIKTGFSTLADCYVNKDFVKILQMMLDPSEPTRVRIKAAQMMGDLVPRTLVHRLFLAPDHVLGRGETLQFRRQLGARERIQLFDAHDRDIVQPALLGLFDEVVIDLAAADDHARDQERVLRRAVRDQSLEGARGQVFH